MLQTSRVIMGNVANFKDVTHEKKKSQIGITYMLPKYHLT